MVGWVWGLGFYYGRLGMGFRVYVGFRVLLW